MDPAFAPVKLKFRCCKYCIELKIRYFIEETKTGFYKLAVIASLAGAGWKVTEIGVRMGRC
jgi:hypothetical protein